MRKFLLATTLFFIFSSYSLDSMAHIEGHGLTGEAIHNHTKAVPLSSPISFPWLLFGLVSGGAFLLISLNFDKKKKAYVASFSALSLSLVAYSACTESTSSSTGSVGSAATATDPESLNGVFAHFKETVQTTADDNYFYVSSQGFPTHNMMVGITNWQQQVPLPQNYTEKNSWSIPLKPQLSDSPISTKNNLYRGAIGVAANGIPIFNALNNRGDDAFLVGELDQWGGHCGRADDYHYHIAPLHLQKTVGDTNPIAYALDGFAVYGAKEPDGSELKALDENNGHIGSDGVYHYHGTTTYPYMIGAMRGKIEINQDEVSPQPRTIPVRPAGEPLRGASITGFKNTGSQSYSLEYTLSNQTHLINYSWTDAAFAFDFVSPTGETRTETYSRK